VKKRSRLWFFLSGSILILAACAPARATAPAGEAPYPVGGEYFGPVATDAEKTLLTPMPPADAPVPRPGLASLSGALYSYTTRQLISETMFYLTPGQGENRDSMPPFLSGPESTRGDISGRSDAYGNFSLDNVPPGSYFLIVSAPYNWCPAEVTPDNPAARLIRLEAGERLALGIVYVSWP
jgi:hypothetical protein